MRSPALHVVSTVLLVLAIVSLGGLVVADSDADDPQNVSLYVTDDDEFDIERSEAAIHDGTLERADETFFGEDTLVVELESTKLATALDERNGTVNERFFDALDGNLTFSLIQTNPTTMMVPMVVEVGPENTTVHQNETTTYIGIETAQAEPGWAGSAVPDAEIRGEETFAVRFGTDMDDSFAHVGPETEFQPTGAAFSGLGGDVLAPEVVNETVDVYTEPDDELFVRATLGDGTVLNETVTDVDWSGGDGFSLDIRTVDAGTEYVLELVYDGEVVDERNGTIEEPAASLTDTHVELEEADDDLPEEVVGWMNVTAELSHGGRVILQDDRGADLGSRGVSPAEEVELSRQFAATEIVSQKPEKLYIKAIRQTGMGDIPYPDTNVTVDVSELDWESLSESTETPTPEPTPTPEESTPKPEDGPVSDDVDLSDDINGDDSGVTPPSIVLGFLWALVALGLLVGAVSILRRR